MASAWRRRKVDGYILRRRSEGRGKSGGYRHCFHGLLLSSARNRVFVLHSRVIRRVCLCVGLWPNRTAVGLHVTSQDRGFGESRCGWKHGRIHHLLSRPETNYFYCVEWEDRVVDIREQFPLLPQEDTQRIARSLGIKRHPKDPVTGQDKLAESDVRSSSQRLQKAQGGAVRGSGRAVSVEQ